VQAPTKFELALNTKAAKAVPHGVCYLLSEAREGIGQ
jgi:hypothetical protein